MESRLVLASGNTGKLREIADLLVPLGFDVVSQAQLQVIEAEETGSTFIENALIKARNACEQTGLPALSDDSGLVVPALGGAPGIFSARYAGPERDFNANIDHLLDELQGHTGGARAAYYYCVLVYMRHADDPTPIVAQGRWDGMIQTTRAGEQGFGYDPVFYAPQFGCSVAELTPALKNQHSHRAVAFAKMKDELAACLEQVQV